MVAVEPGQLVPGELAEPGVELLGRVLEAEHFLRGLGQYDLHYIGRIETGSQA
jgi:hypothetical protein